MIILTLSSQRNPRLAGRFDYVFFGSRAIHSDCFLDTEMPFAPTATDILAELGPYSLVSQGDWIVSKWVKDESGALTIVEKRFFAANHAEATAKAWLAIHEKKDLEK